ncbi:serine protease ami-like [Anopheles ziemanni]|uniref:serine protease ami-like n=1 Tax=Anopheles coustani TaxID=139045 RepID=UPI0026581E87|nr:serine protease ami-like [Anopheles coustani]XP_058178014.1 serine protease ami-like [Anopheles ziemanni]
MELVPVLLLALACVQPATVLGQLRIYEAEDASRMDFPFMAIVTHSRDVVGNGVIVATKWVLTTSNVLYQFPESTFCAVIGGDTLSSSSWYDTVRVWKHPEWDGSTYNIGLMQLSRTIKYTAVVQPIGIASVNPQGLAGTMISFGENNSGSTRMKKAQVVLSSDDACANIISTYVNQNIIRSGHGYCLAVPNGKEYRFESDDNGGAIVVDNLLYALFDITNEKDLMATRVTEPEMRSWVDQMTS